MTFFHIILVVVVVYVYAKSGSWRGLLAGARAAAAALRWQYGVFCLSSPLPQD